MTLSAAAVVLAPLSACASHTVPMPPFDATPEQVVRTYLEAQQARDCRTYQALRAPTMQPSLEPGECEFLNLTDFRVVRSQPDKRGHYHDEHPQHDRIYVELVIGRGAEDHGFHRGENQWSYYLDRSGRGAPWRIFAQGMG